VEYATNNVVRLSLDFMRSLELGENAQEWLSKSPRKPLEDVNDIVKQAIDYAHAHVRDDLTMSDVSKALGTSERHLHRLFKQEMHVTASEYLKNLKMEEAHKLLTTTSLSIKEVGSRTGFNYMWAFTRAFKRHWGSLPSIVREKARGRPKT
jgi:transcriptional regulator GlxA family with amidase domain